MRDSKDAATPRTLRGNEMGDEDLPELLHPATVMEAISDAIPDRLALVRGAERRTWREFEARAASLAAGFMAAGLGPGSRVVLYMQNSPAYLEAHLATFKVRGAPINGNYRYLPEELLYLIENSDAEAVVFDEALAPRVAALIGKIGAVKLLVEVGASGAVPGSVSLADIIAAHSPAPRIQREADDLQFTYTGGTTGLPKGVVRPVGPYIRGIWTIGARGAGDMPPRTLAGAVDAAVARSRAGKDRISVVGPPFMHGTGLAFGAMLPLVSGGCVVMLPSSFDAAEMLRLIDQYRATVVTITGDVMARPLVEALDLARDSGAPYDLSSVEVFYSSGMIWTADVKRRLLDYAPQAELMDIVGSSEGGIGVSRSTKAHIPETGVFTPNPTTTVLTPDGRPVAPGSGEAGLIAASGGTVGAGYHKDPKKSAQTYRNIGGVNYVIAGDWATIDADGSIRFLGRDSACINTGGEKVFAEEVENVILGVHGVADCLVVGIPDPRWGQAVGALVARNANSNVGVAEVQHAVRSALAGYKIPRQVHFVASVPRGANGKPDYKTARQIMTESATT